jgi:hypothetical protein
MSPTTGKRQDQSVAEVYFKTILITILIIPKVMGVRILDISL